MDVVGGAVVVSFVSSLLVELGVGVVVRNLDGQQEVLCN